jgi:CDP-glycerol glycerophosphotransferase (TagB/SpsB family)
MTADLWNRTDLHRCRRRINFFHGVAGKYDLDDPRKLGAADLPSFDRIAFINRDRMDRYLSAGAISARQAVLVGFPKADELVNGRWQAHAVRASLGLAPTLDTVLYAPTFSPANSLHLAGPAIVETLLASGRNVIVKLHDRSMVPHAKFTEGVDWPARLAVYERHPRFALARAADAGPFLAAADVLVTDHSTVGFEFALLDRPIVVFDAPRLREAARIDADKWALLRSMADVVDTVQALRSAVDTALAAPERLRAERQQAHALFAHAGQATERALDVVYELLELARTAAGEATSSALPRYSTPASPPRRARS